MLINATKSRLVIGRFSILPGEKVPAFQLTGEEAAAVDKFKNSGRLVEKPGNHTVVEAPVVEKPAPKPAGRSRKQSSESAESKSAEQDTAVGESSNTLSSTEPVSQSEGE